VSTKIYTCQPARLSVLLGSLRDGAGESNFFNVFWAFCSGNRGAQEFNDEQEQGFGGSLPRALSVIIDITSGRAQT
jgi:hypothetical protein